MAPSRRNGQGQFWAFSGMPDVGGTVRACMDAPSSSRTSQRLLRFVALVLGVGMVAAACTTSTPDGESAETTETTEAAAPSTTVVIPALPTGAQQDFGDPPSIPDGPLTPEVNDAIESLFGPTLEDGLFDSNELEALDVLGNSGDVRVGWLLSDLLNFVRGEDTRPGVANNATKLLDITIQPPDDRQQITDRLIAWDVPAPPDYFRHKKRLFSFVERDWEPFFDEAGDVDWRYIGWGGVFIDDRPFGQTDQPCPSRGCIPAIDNPPASIASGGDWYPDDAFVFGVEINGETRAYPRHIMEIREMVNDTLGGRDFAMPYCTLCGSAQVFFTDEVEGFDRPVMRTSGLLNRSNKVMFDLRTNSVFDTFLGAAVTGPMAAAGVVLPQASVVTTTWGEWKEEHPETSILREELALGQGLNPLRGRDDNGPIFPIGDVDPRLPVQEPILGVISPDSGEPIAFHVATAVATLANGETIEVDGITILAAAGGIRAVNDDGDDLGGHQAFWFAWSQFHPDTNLWPAS